MCEDKNMFSCRKRKSIKDNLIHLQPFLIGSLVKVTLMATVIILTNVYSEGDTSYLPINYSKPRYVAVEKVFSRDVTERAEYCNDNTVRIFKQMSDTLISEFPIEGDNDYVNKMWYNENGQLKVVTNRHVYSKIKSTKEVIRYDFPDKMLGDFQVSRDGSKIIYSDNNESIYYYDLKLNKSKMLCDGCKLFISRHFYFTPDNSKILIFYPDSAVQLRMVESDSIVMYYNLSNVNTSFTFISEDGSFFAVSTNTGEMAIVDTKTGKIYKTLKIPENEYGEIKTPFEWDGMTKIVFSGDNKHIIAKDYRNAFVWEIQSGDLLFSQQVPYWASNRFGDCWFTQDGKSVVFIKSNYEDRTDSLFAWNIDSKEASLMFREQRMPYAEYKGLSWNGEILCIGSYSYRKMISEDSTFLYDSVLYWYDKSNLFFKPSTFVSLDNYSSIEYYFTKDGTRLIEEMKGNFVVYDIVNGGKELFRHKYDGISDMVLSQDNKYLFIFNSFYESISTGTFALTTTKVDMKTGNNEEITFKFPHSYGWKPRTIVSSDSILVAVREPSNNLDSVSVGIWNIKTGQQIKAFNLNSSAYGIPILLPDQNTLAITSRHGILTYNLLTEKIDSIEIEYDTSTYYKIITPNGRYVLIKRFLYEDMDKVVTDTNIYCCDLKTGKIVRTYLTKCSPGDICFNPVNENQFLIGTEMWELPELSTIKSDIRHNDKVQLKVVNVTANCVNINAKAIREIDQSEIEFKLYNLMGKQVIRLTIDKNTPILSIKTTGMTPGMYIYLIANKSGTLKESNLLIMR